MMAFAIFIYYSDFTLYYMSEDIEFVCHIWVISLGMPLDILSQSLQSRTIIIHLGLTQISGTILSVFEHLDANI